MIRLPCHPAPLQGQGRLALEIFFPDLGHLAAFQVFIKAHDPVDEAGGGELDDPVGDGGDELMVVGGEEDHLRKAISPLFRAVIDSRSRWLVGSSKISTLASVSIIRASMQRTFSPPESTWSSSVASSPEKSMRPKKPAGKALPFVGGANWRSHSTRFISFSK